jgi:glycosyltransferase involved in cell wall biosynthesis
LHLIALVESPEHVCCRYRLAALRPYLEPAGHRLELHSWPKGWWSRIWVGKELAHADLVIVQRRLLSALQLYMLRRSVKRLTFDYDDAVFLRDSYSGALKSMRRQRRFAAMIAAADLVIAGNVFLSVHAARWTPSDRVHVVPTCVDLARYDPAAHHRSGAGVQLVWVGSSSTLAGLELVRPLLEEIGQRCPEVRLKLICDRFLQLDRLPVLACPWSEQTEAAEIADADIGISWVPDDAWSRGKCGLKVLQYMAAGLPVIANPVGVQSEFVRHGETGFLAETADQWVYAVRRLANDPVLRRQMGEAARRCVAAELSVRHAAKAWLGLLEGMQRRQAA